MGCGPRDRRGWVRAVWVGAVDRGRRSSSSPTCPRWIRTRPSGPTARLHWATNRSPVEVTPATAQRLACDATLRSVITDGTHILGVTAAHPKVGTHPTRPDLTVVPPTQTSIPTDWLDSTLPTPSCPSDPPDHPRTGHPLQPGGRAVRTHAPRSDPPRNPAQIRPGPAKIRADQRDASTPGGGDAPRRSRRGVVRPSPGQQYHDVVS